MTEKTFKQNTAHSEEKKPYLTRHVTCSSRGNCNTVRTPDTETLPSQAPPTSFRMMKAAVLLALLCVHNTGL